MKDDDQEVKGMWWGWDKVQAGRSKPANLFSLRLCIWQLSFTKLLPRPPASYCHGPSCFLEPVRLCVASTSTHRGPCVGQLQHDARGLKSQARRHDRATAKSMSSQHTHTQPYTSYPPPFTQSRPLPKA